MKILSITTDSFSFKVGDWVESSVTTKIFKIDEIIAHREADQTNSVFVREKDKILWIDSSIIQKVTSKDISLEMPDLSRPVGEQNGRIFLCGETLANFWQNPDDKAYGRAANKWIFNRDGLALKLELPIAPDFNTTEEMINWTKEQIDNLNK